jgi:hypothetical protein
MTDDGWRRVSLAQVSGPSTDEVRQLRARLDGLTIRDAVAGLASNGGKPIARACLGHDYSRRNRKIQLTCEDSGAPCRF